MSQMKMIYDVDSRPPFGKLVVFSLQQLLAIITATIAVPMVVSSEVSGDAALVMNPAAALIGAGFGTITYLLFTKFKSPVFLGSSFAFIQPLIGAVSFGYFGVLVGAAFAAAVYALIALVVKLAGTKWVNKLMPPVVIGPTVALIGLSLAGSAMGDITKASGSGQAYNLIGLLCGLVTFFVVVFCSLKGNKTMKLIPFVIGISAGYVLASLFSIFGYVFKVDYLKIVNWQPLVDNFNPVNVESFINWDFSFLHAEGDFKALDDAGVANIALLYIPVSFVVFAEHLADHKNIRIRRLAEYHLRRIRRLRCYYQKRFRFVDPRRIRHGNSIGVLFPDSRFYGNHSQQRHGRRVFVPVRVYRRFRFEYVKGYRPWRIQEFVCRVLDFNSGYRRLVLEIRRRYRWEKSRYRNFFDSYRVDIGHFGKRSVQRKSKRRTR